LTKRSDPFARRRGAAADRRDAAIAPSGPRAVNVRHEPSVPSAPNVRTKTTIKKTTPSISPSIAAFPPGKRRWAWS
jgi:hypothetical protein